MRIESLNEVTITVANLGRSAEFYQSVLGMLPLERGSGRLTLGFGRQRLRLVASCPLSRGPLARSAPGSYQLSLRSALPMAEVAAHLLDCEVPVEDGPYRRQDAFGARELVTFRDPDGNLIEISHSLGPR